jgi:hypothetical protein
MGDRVWNAGKLELDPSCRGCRVLKCHTFVIFNLFKYNIGFNRGWLNYQKDLLFQYSTFIWYTQLLKKDATNHEFYLSLKSWYIEKEVNWSKKASICLRIYKNIIFVWSISAALLLFSTIHFLIYPKNTIRNVIVYRLLILLENFYFESPHLEVIPWIRFLWLNDIPKLALANCTCQLLEIRLFDTQLLWDLST